MKPIYDVPVVPNNLRHKETIIQIADALDYLNKVFEDILLRVNTRIIEKQNHVSGLKDRISTVNQKMQRLTQTKKATQVFSNTKYPSNKPLNKYKSIFNLEDHDEIKFERSKVKFDELGVNEQIQNVLQFYHVKIKTEKEDMSGIGRSSLEGLGCFPANAQLVNELLLFNTLKNPYKNYEVSDPLFHYLQDNVKNTDETTQGPDAAPLSMTQRSGAMRPSKEEYFYSPDMGIVPTIDVPLDLPDLPGIADDLRYLMELGPGIAPSATTTPVIPELPSVTPSSSLYSPIVQSPRSEISDAEVSVPDSLPELPAVPPSLPPPPEEVPLLPIETQEPIVIQKVNVQKSDSNISSNESTTSQPVTSRKLTPETDISAESRASLMEAIRRAGSMKKSVLNSIKKDQPSEQNKNQVNISLFK